MAQSKIKGRTIDGKFFKSFVKFKKKSNAQKTANALRKRNDQVRIVKTKGKFPFELVTRKGRRK